MTSPSVTNLATVTHTELRCLQLLVKEYVTGKTTEAIWIAFCVHHGVPRATAEATVKRLREKVNALEL